MFTGFAVVRGAELAAVEAEAFGIDHAAVGALWVETIGFPQPVADTIRKATQPASDVDAPLDLALRSACVARRGGGAEKQRRGGARVVAGEDARAVQRRRRAARRRASPSCTRRCRRPSRASDPPCAPPPAVHRTRPPGFIEASTTLQELDCRASSKSMTRRASVAAARRRQRTESGHAASRRHPRHCRRARRPRAQSRRLLRRHQQHADRWRPGHQRPAPARLPAQARRPGGDPALLRPRCRHARRGAADRADRPAQAPRRPHRRARLGPRRLREHRRGATVPDAELAAGRPHLLLRLLARRLHRARGRRHGQPVRRARARARAADPDPRQDLLLAAARGRAGARAQELATRARPLAATSAWRGPGKAAAEATPARRGSDRGSPATSSPTRCGETSRARPAVHWVGVWDTVESVGLPLLGSRDNPSTATFHDKPNIHHVRHALALDEHRWPFLPRLYDAPSDFADRDGRTSEAALVSRRALRRRRQLRGDPARQHLSRSAHRPQRPLAAVDDQRGRRRARRAAAAHALPCGGELPYDDLGMPRRRALPGDAAAASRRAARHAVLGARRDDGARDADAGRPHQRRGGAGRRRPQARRGAAGARCRRRHQGARRWRAARPERLGRAPQALAGVRRCVDRGAGDDRVGLEPARPGRRRRPAGQAGATAPARHAASRCSSWRRCRRGRSTSAVCGPSARSHRPAGFATRRSRIAIERCRRAGRWRGTSSSSPPSAT